MELGTLFNFAILLFCGLIFAKIIRYFKLPDVTGYLIGGLIIGPSVLGLLSADAVAGLSLVSDVALGFIAFSIGSEFKLSYFKRVGMTPIVIAIFESFVAVLFVTWGWFSAGRRCCFLLVLGAIAAATAPAATIMVIMQSQGQRGPLYRNAAQCCRHRRRYGAHCIRHCCGRGADADQHGGRSAGAEHLEARAGDCRGAAGRGALGRAVHRDASVLKVQSNRMVLAIAFVGW